MKNSIKIFVMLLIIMPFILVNYSCNDDCDSFCESINSVFSSYIACTTALLNIDCSCTEISTIVIRTPVLPNSCNLESSIKIYNVNSNLINDGDANGRVYSQHNIVTILGESYYERSITLEECIPISKNKNPLEEVIQFLKTFDKISIIMKQCRQDIDNLCTNNPPLFRDRIWLFNSFSSDVLGNGVVSSDCKYIMTIDNSDFLDLGECTNCCSLVN